MTNAGHETALHRCLQSELAARCLKCGRRFNHSCVPNAEYGVNEQGHMKVRVIKPVAQGEKAGLPQSFHQKRPPLLPSAFFHTRVTRDLLWLLWHDFECEDSLLLASMSALTPGVLLLPWRFTTVSRAEATVDILFGRGAYSMLPLQVLLQTLKSHSLVVPLIFLRFSFST